MRRILAAAIVVALLLLAGGAAYLYWPMYRFDDTDAEQVVLLHGLGRGASSMLLLESRLTKAGFAVTNIDYPSLEASPDAIADLVTAEVDECCANNGRPLHLVGHSLGGLVIRAYLDTRQPDNLGRVVLVGTPNAGSEWVDELEDHEFLEELIGPAGMALGTESSKLAALGPPYYPVGVIAGNRSFDVLEGEVFEGENDAMVSVESTKLEGMTDFIVLDTYHGTMRYDGAVACEIVNFLRYERFAHAQDSADCDFF